MEYNTKDIITAFNEGYDCGKITKKKHHVYEHSATKERIALYERETTEKIDEYNTKIEQYKDRLEELCRFQSVGPNACLSTRTAIINLCEPTNKER